MNIQAAAAVYLNQRLIFDMLAALEDGFVQVSTVEREIKNSKNIDGSLEAATNKMFSLFPVKFSGKIEGGAGNQNSHIETGTKIHTPTSLFVKLANNLYESKNIKYITSVTDFSSVQSGDFVSFIGIFRKNPIISILESAKKFCEIAAIFNSLQQGESSKSESKNKIKNQQNIKKEPNFSLISQKIDEILQGMKSKGLTDIICKIKSDDEIRAVLQVYEEFFFNSTLSEITDGEFTAIGKVVLVSTEDNDVPINLLRNTSVSFLNSSAINAGLAMLQSNEDFAKVQQFITIPEIQLEIGGNSMLIIPLAIYA